MFALILDLQAPLMSWGGLSIGDNRDTLTVPTLSAVAGLVGACVGIDRHDRQACLDWYSRWDLLTLQQDLAPPLLVDYQVAREALKADGSEAPAVSHRTYLADHRLLAALVYTGEDEEQAMKTALAGLCNPVYTPYLGRRACPLTELPLPPATKLEDCRFGGYAAVADALLTRFDKLSDHSDKRALVATHGKLSKASGWSHDPAYSKVLHDRRGWGQVYAQRYCDVFLW